MRLRGYVQFGVAKAEGDALRAFARSLECENSVSETAWTNPFFSHRFYEDDARLPIIRAWLAERGGTYAVTWLPVYTTAELRASRLLRLSIRRASVDGGSASDGTAYDDFVGCSTCGTGARQTGPALVIARELPRRGLLCETHHGLPLSREPLTRELRAAGISGIELRQVIEHKKRIPLPWWQWILQFTLPRMSAATRGIVRDTKPGWGCPVCQRNMHGERINVVTEIAYDAAAVHVDALPDIMATWECHGRSVLKPDPERHLVRGFAQPFVIVKPRVMELMRSLKVREASFEPVRIVGD
jgi:hypothetical protein